MYYYYYSNRGVWSSPRYSNIRIVATYIIREQLQEKHELEEVESTGGLPLPLLSWEKSKQLHEEATL